MTTIDHYATEIMNMIDDDVHGGAMPKTVASFQQLHEHVDANEYMIQADVPWDPDDETAMKFYVDVQDEIGDRLARRAGLTAGTPVRFYLAETPDLHEGVVTEPYYTEGENAGHVMVKGADGIERMLSASDIRIDEDLVELPSRADGWDGLADDGYPLGTGA